jgi:hypothetical protein
MDGPIVFVPRKRMDPNQLRRSGQGIKDAFGQLWRWDAVKEEWDVSDVTESLKPFAKNGTHMKVASGGCDAPMSLDLYLRLYVEAADDHAVGPVLDAVLDALGTSQAERLEIRPYPKQEGVWEAEARLGVRVRSGAGTREIDALVDRLPSARWRHLGAAAVDWRRPAVIDDPDEVLVHPAVLAMTIETGSDGDDEGDEPEELMVKPVPEDDDFRELVAGLMLLQQDQLDGDQN